MSYMEKQLEFVARKYGVSSLIHEDDFMFKYYIDQDRDFDLGGNGVEYYFKSGNDSFELVLDLTDKFYKKDKSKITMLEFASGYGCVTRHFAKVKQSYNVVPCDIHNNALTFIKKITGIDGILSSPVPENLIIGQKYAVIFVLSFFSHMPHKTWGRWLNALFELLEDEGILIFTTHGNNTYRDWMQNDAIRNFWGNLRLDRKGYWFSPKSEQLDLSTDEYGTTIVTPQYVTSHIYKNNSMELVFFQESMWWGVQDTYIVRKISS